MFSCGFAERVRNDKQFIWFKFARNYYVNQQSISKNGYQLKKTPKKSFEKVAINIILLNTMQIIWIP